MVNRVPARQHSKSTSSDHFVIALRSMTCNLFNCASRATKWSPISSSPESAAVGPAHPRAEADVADQPQAALSEPFRRVEPLYKKTKQRLPES